ncbi:epoxide hydrolase [Sphingobium sp. 22B]|nr:epoxide hydrolase [Sphingobium sp. AM]KYC32802.1 epoxide hydrolase [Sphingobium sp. 22B]OAP31687.1 epoxide hydrolase [Sphingobium sp. 20006FA]
MHYVEQGEGPLVLLLHGWPESCHSWRHQMPALAAAGYRVVAPDQRGYGHSDAPTEVGSYNILNLTGDLVGLVDALGEKEACLIGHDWGATLTAVAALLRPDLFRLIGLLSVPYRPRRKVRPAARFHLATQEKHFYQDYFQQPGRVERELEEDIRRALLGIYYTASAEGVEKRPDASFVTFDKSMRMVDNLAIPDTLPDWLTEADLDVFVEQFRHSGFHGPTNWYRNLDHNWQITPFLDGAKIGQPTLFLAGERDGVLQMAAEELEALAHNVPNLWRKHLIPGAGHWAQQERPQETNEVLIEFLSAHKPGKPG